MKRTLNIQKTAAYGLLLIATTGLLFSCTKTKYTDYEQETKNRVQEYRVVNAQQEMPGIIDNITNTITVYIPYYSGIEYLNAEIKLDEGARLLDSTGKEINLDGGLDPVRINPDSVRVQYTVAPATGNPRTYTLIQKILPHGDSLQAKYAYAPNGIDGDIIPMEGPEYVVPVNYSLFLIGNFESTSANATIILTDKATGKEYDTLIRGVRMTLGEGNYHLQVHISPNAPAGEYQVRMEHQGRIARLPPLQLFYQKNPGSRGFSSADSYAAGDTIAFSPHQLYSYHEGFTGIYMPIERVYVKIKANDAFERYPSIPDFKVPPGFPESLYDTEIEMKIISQSRTEVKAIFPELPAGSYTDSYDIYDEEAEAGYPVINTNFGFYADFEDGYPGWGKGYIIGRASTVRFNVSEKK